jgi:hypothetical protein
MKKGPPQQIVCHSAYEFTTLSVTLWISRGIESEYPKNNNAPFSQLETAINHARNFSQGVNCCTSSTSNQHAKMTTRIVKKIIDILKVFLIVTTTALTESSTIHAKYQRANSTLSWSRQILNRQESKTQNWKKINFKLQITNLWILVISAPLSVYWPDAVPRLCCSPCDHP